MRMVVTSFPSWERGLKLTDSVSFDEETRSFPSWERGLKLEAAEEKMKSLESFPSWERGLKHQKAVYFPFQDRRSPRGNVD